MKYQKYRHCTRHNGKFVFQLKVLGHSLYPNEHWDTEEDAACAADLTKHYFRENFFIDLPASLDPEIFNVMAYRLNVVLSDFLSVGAALPPGVSTFLLKHRDELERYALNNKPERPAWEIMRSNQSPGIPEWVRACELAEQDVLAFASINSGYLLDLLGGLVKRFEDALSPLRKAVKMHANARADVNLGSVKLAERKAILNALLNHLEADLVYISALPGSIRDEEDAVKLALHSLSNSRPPLT